MAGEDRAYCPCCRKAVLFRVENTMCTTSLDGESYKYPVKVARCAECGEEAVYPPFQEDAGVAFENAVRAKKGIISLDKVKEIPKKYRIGKRPLSRLLGWGELTYSRFVEGRVPSKKYSDALERIYAEPEAYYRLLEAHKDSISHRAYEKSKSAVEALMNDRFPESTKIYEVADYFIDLADNDLTPYMLQKLTYYAQGFSLVFLEKPLFVQEPKAWAAGPVYGQLWFEYKDKVQAGEPQGAACPEDRDGFSPFAQEEEELLREIYRAFGCYSGQLLSMMTHNELPWRNARKREGAKDGEHGSAPVRLEDMRTFFEHLKERWHMATPEDIVRYARAAGNYAMGNV